MKIIKRFIKIFLLVFSLLLIIVGSIYFLFVVVDGQIWSNDSSYSSSDYIGNSSIGSDGKITTTNTVQEVWDKKKEKKGRVNLYLQDAKELAKLMNAELATQFLDTRPNPDEPIDWDSESINNPNSNDL